MSKVLMSKVKELSLDQIEFVDGNREVDNRHVQRMVSLISENGFADTVKVVEQNNKYYAVEGQHRVEALRYLEVNSVLCSVIDWMDNEEFDDIQSFIISLNSNNKVWTLYDYTKSWSDKGLPQYKKLRSQMISYSKTLSNGVVATMYDGVSRSHNQLKTGNLRLINEEFSDHMIEQFSLLVSKWGKRKFPAAVLRHAVYIILREKDPYGMLNAFKIAAVSHLSTSQDPLPDGDETFKYWFENTVQTYYKSLKG